MKSDFSITLIVPCYNEEANLNKGTLEKIGAYTAERKEFLEVLIIDDGSTDRSKERIKNDYLHKYPKLRLIENNHTGKAFAIITGIRESQGDYIMFSDFDLATPIEEAQKLIQGVKEGYSVVIGSRDTNREGAPFARKILTFGSIIVRNVLIGLYGIKDTQCGFKMFERNAAFEIIDKLQVFKEEHVLADPSVSAGFDIEFLFIAKRLGCSIKEVPVVWRHVESKRVNFKRDAIEALKDIVKIRWYEIIRLYDFSKKKYLVDIL